jgi:competence protein ComEC
MHLLSAMLGIAMLARWRLSVAFLAGFAWAWLAADGRLSQDLPGRLEGVDTEVVGRVASLPSLDETGIHFVIDVDRADAGIPPRIRLSWYDTRSRPQPGESWRFVVRLKRRNSTANPGGFDYEAYLFREGIGATGYVRSDAGNTRLAAPAGSFVLRMRAWIAQRIELAIGKGQATAIIKGLAVGDTQAIAPEQWRVFAATGTTHLMAISGMHIGMVAMLAAWCGGRLARLRRAQSWRVTVMHGRVVAGATAAVGYSLLAGLSVPTQRTLVMLCIWFGTLWWRRHASFAHALGIALIAVLLLDPFAPLAVGAWLSFVAVTVIVLAQGGRLQRARKVGSFTGAQVAVTVGLTPLLLTTFGSLSLVSPIANAVAVPLFTLVLVPLVLVGSFAAACWPPAGSPLLGIAAWLLDAAWPSLEWLAGQSVAVWHFPHLPAPEVAALCCGALLLLLPGLSATRVLGILLCLPAMLYRPSSPASGDYELTVLDVGQGLAVVVRTGTHVLVYDTGPAFRSGRDAGEQVVLPYLRYYGVQRIDALVVSHGDLDHSGGMASLAQALPVGQTIAGPSVAPADRQGTRCNRGQQWSWDGIRFSVLHPQGSARSADNDSSCVLRIAGAGGSALLAGDIEAASEQVLVENGLPATDIVVVPHHGSRSSSTAGFVHALEAKLAVFSSGYRNRWGFPQPDMVRRWSDAGAQTFLTSDSGAVEISVRAGQAMTIREYRREHRHYWNR